MKIDYHGPQHKKVLDFICKCFKMSEDAISQRYKGWEKADKMDRSFIDVSETDDKGKKKNPFERQIYVPHSRACKDTILTYWLNVMAGKRPMIRLAGRGPEDVRPAHLNEIVMDYQAERQRMILVLHTFLNDVIKYGLGSIKGTYGREWAQSYRTVSKVELFPRPHIVRVREAHDYVKYEGPLFTNNDVYRYYPDPRYPQSQATAGQFVGFEYTRSKYYLQKKQSEGVYYNIDMLQQASSGANSETDTSGSRTERERIRGISSNLSNGGAAGLDDINPHYKIRELWVEIVPRDLGIEDGSSFPEEWVFAVADDRVIIRSEKNEFAHGGKPEVRAEFDRDGYSLFNLGFYESVEGLQDLLNFMYNSHIDNVRGYLNNMMVFDPSAIETADLMRPGPRRLVRMKKSLYGQPGASIDQVLRQLQMGDVTASHIRDASMIMDTMQRQAHTPDSLQGVETEIRRTATEIARLSSSGGTHLGQGAMLVYAQAIIPLAEQWLQNNQKFLSEERFYRITGDYAKEIQADTRYKGGRGVMVGPDDLQGHFDFPIDDGRLPADPRDNADVWIKILEIVGSTPPIQQRIDVMTIMEEAVKAMGVKDFERFKLKANVMPDEQLARMEEKGDIIDLNQYMAGRQPAAL